MLWIFLDDDGSWNGDLAGYGCQAPTAVPGLTKVLVKS